MNITLDISSSRDLVLLRITSDVILSNTDIGTILDSVSQDLKAEHRNVPTIDPSQITDGNET